jgi:hypothetical protein
MRPSPRRIAGGLGAAVLGGGVTAALLLGPTIGSAATDTTEPSTDEPTSDGTTETGDDGSGVLDETLAQLVEDGVLTQEQADEVAETLRADLPPIVMIAPGLPGEPGGPGRFDREFGPDEGTIRIGPARQHLDTIAEAIGIEPEALLEELRGGATVAEVAEANGVDPQAVIDALVAEYTERVTEWVESGASTDESADEEPTDESTDVTDTTEATTT